MTLKHGSKYKTFKSDAAPFLFFIDVLPIDLTQYEIIHHIKLLKNVKHNPIMPLPLRVDKVYNGELSILIRPSKPISFEIGQEYVAIVNSNKIVEYGIKKLLIFTEIRASERTTISLSKENAIKWCNSTKSIYGRLIILEEDLSAFIKAYLHTMLTAKINETDLVSAAIKYCNIIEKICQKRINDNQIIVQVKEKEKIVELYKMKSRKVLEKFKRVKKQFLYPSLVDIEILNLEKTGFSEITNGYKLDILTKSKVMKYIPLLIYDDLLECMLQNLETLKDFEGDIIDPSFLFENNIIKVFDDEIQEPEKYSWLKDFNQVNITKIMDSFNPTFPYDLR
jgi:hypothetical protein